MAQPIISLFKRKDRFWGNTAISLFQKRKAYTIKITVYKYKIKALF